MILKKKLPYLSGVIVTALSLSVASAQSVAGDIPSHPVNIIGIFHLECMHASHSSRVGSGKDVYHRRCTSSRSDRFYFKPSSKFPGYYRLKNEKFRTCLHASSVDRRIYHTKCQRGNPKDYFKIIRQKGGHWTIQSKYSGMCVHFSSNIRAEDGKNLAIYQSPCNGSDKNRVFFRK